VPSIANYRLIRNRHWLISVSGGVKISPEDMIRPERRDTKAPRVLSGLRETTIPPKDPIDWWWDDKPE
jgi:hypothetical protein